MSHPMHTPVTMVRMAGVGMTSGALLLGTLLLGTPGCLKDESLDTNLAPQAQARAFGRDGKIVDEKSDGGVEDLRFDYDGEPVTVKLDGSGSSDRDGHVIGYRWRSANLAPDGGMGVYNGEDGELDPKDVERPVLHLEPGNYTFTLWVTDNSNAVSKPDSISLSVGVDPVAQCIDGAYETIDDTCRQCVCDQGADCQAAIPMCDKDCWGLIGCIATSCPTFTMDMDTTCVVNNCGPFLGGSTGAMAAGSCIGPCATECTPSITAIVTGM